MILLRVNRGQRKWMDGPLPVGSLMQHPRDIGGKELAVELVGFRTRVLNIRSPEAHCAALSFCLGSNS